MRRACGAHRLATPASLQSPHASALLRRPRDVTAKEEQQQQSPPAAANRKEEIAPAEQLLRLKNIVVATTAFGGGTPFGMMIAQKECRSSAWWNPLAVLQMSKAAEMNPLVYLVNPEATRSLQMVGGALVTGAGTMTAHYLGIRLPKDKVEDQEGKSSEEQKVAEKRRKIKELTDMWEEERARVHGTIHSPGGERLSEHHQYYGSPQTPTHLPAGRHVQAHAESISRYNHNNYSYSGGDPNREPYRTFTSRHICARNGHNPPLVLCPTPQRRRSSFWSFGLPMTPGPVDRSGRNGLFPSTPPHLSQIPSLPGNPHSPPTPKLQILADGRLGLRTPGKGRWHNLPDGGALSSLSIFPRGGQDGGFVAWNPHPDLAPRTLLY